MPQHLFKYTDLEVLENNPMEGDFEVLIVGTFNGDIEGNLATWFYGRPENEFWCLFPRMLGKASLHPVDRDENIEVLTLLWKQFCADHKVIVVDLFKDILIELPNHADKLLAELEPNEYIAFGFERAFANCKFKKVMFTWKGMNPSTLTNLKQAYIRFFEQRGSRMAHLLTPSIAYAKSRYFKLNQWKEAYTHE